LGVEPLAALADEAFLGEAPEVLALVIFFTVFLREALFWVDLPVFAIAIKVLIMEFILL